MEQKAGVGSHTNRKDKGLKVSKIVADHKDVFAVLSWGQAQNNGENMKQ